MTAARINKNGVPERRNGPPPPDPVRCHRAMQLVDVYNLSLFKAAEVLAAEGKGTGPDGKTVPHKSTVADWVERGRKEDKRINGGVPSRKRARSARARRIRTMRADTYQEFLAGDLKWAEAAAVFKWLEEQEARLTGSDKPLRTRSRVEATGSGTVRVMTEADHRAVLGEEPPEPP